LAHDIEVMTDQFHGGDRSAKSAGCAWRSAGESATRIGVEHIMRTDLMVAKIKEREK